MPRRPLGGTHRGCRHRLIRHRSSSARQRSTDTASREDSLRRPTAFSSRDTASQTAGGFSENSSEHARIFTSRMSNGTWPPSRKLAKRSIELLLDSIPRSRNDQAETEWLRVCMYVISSPSPVLLAFLFFPVSSSVFCFPFQSQDSSLVAFTLQEWVGTKTPIFNQVCS